MTKINNDTALPGHLFGQTSGEITEKLTERHPLYAAGSSIVHSPFHELCSIPRKPTPKQLYKIYDLHIYHTCFNIFR